MTLTSKQLGLADNPMIKDSDPFASDKGAPTPLNLADEIEHHRGNVAVSIGGEKIMCRYITPEELPVILDALRR